MAAAISTIRLFSTFLSNVESSDPPSMTSSAKVDIFTHLSTLLNTGHPSGQVVAVTGCVQSDGGATVTIIISSNSSSKATDSSSKAKLSSSSRKATAASEKEQFFEIESCKPSGLTSSPPRYAVTAHKFIRWLVHRCHAKISHRFETAAREWHQKPWVIMEKWSPSDEDLKKTKCSRIEPPSAYMEYIRSNAQHITVGQDNVSLLFDHFTLKHWVHFLAELLAGADKLSSSWWTLGEPGLRRLCDALGMINFLLDTKELKFAILTTSLCESFNPKYPFRRTRVVADGDGTDDEELSEKPERNEDAGQHVLRYLRTLTAWHTAGKAVVQTLRRMSRPPQISIVRLTDGSSTFGTDRDSMSREVQERIIATEPKLDRDIVSQWVDGILRVRKGRVHAEAGLMALAYYVKHDPVKADAEVPKNLFELFSVVCTFLCFFAACNTH
ncbi:hypothetical protein C8Q74DRAFT_757635 [Fomes fomentarius]|nr:hypothetical protein C8Q74DRAFT_757635 [Fomes fomentarius]